MERTNTTYDEQPQSSPAKKKKGHAGLIIFLIILILAAGSGAGYYFYQRQLPAKAVEKFLTGMQKMDFESMAALLQSSDLSALDNADIRNEAYTEFFKNINQKMTYKIKKNNFDIQNGTAQVTAHIKYFDGSDIYKETISEFLRQIVSTALSGEDVTAAEAQAQQKLASILNEKAASAEDKFSETDITYPVIKENNQWKIVALDDETVKIMSANFKNVEDEINRSLTTMEDDGESETSAGVQAASADDTIDMAGEKFTIHYTQHRIARDFGGKPCILVYYDYTNNSSSPSSAMVDINLQAYQNGELCEAAIPEKNDDAIDHFMTEIQPGETVNVCQAFALNGESDVTLQASEAFNFGNGTTTSQILKVK